MPFTNEPTTSPLRVGIIGCGDVALRVHLPALEAAGAQVTRFASKNLADAQAAADAATAEAMATDDWRQLVASPHIDAVDICTPNHLHAEMTMAAIEAGKHVLVESPMALTVRDADSLLKAAARKGKMLVPAHSVRFIGPYAALAQACRDGKIGQITAARVEFGHGGPDQINPEATWYLEKAKAGGGALIDLGVPVIDLLRLALGAEVTEVAARIGGSRGDVESNAQARFKFSSGAIADVLTSWEGAANQVTITGTEAEVRLDSSGTRIVHSDGTEERLRPIPQEAGGIEAVFVNAVSGDTTPSVNALDGRAAVAAIAAAYDSAVTGEPVQVPAPAW